MSIVQRVDYIITRGDVQANPNVLYLFGDNSIRRGLGGQAKQMRGEPNAIGIITKKYPCNEDRCFLSDEFYTTNKIDITVDIDRVINKFKRGGYINIIIPPLGVGMAKLPEKAPKTWEWLQSELNRLENTINNSLRK